MYLHVARFSGWLLVTTLALAGAACNDSEFSGATKNRAAQEAPAIPAKVIPVQLTCNDAAMSDTAKNISVKGNRKDKVQIKGEFCPRAYAELTVMFVVDISGSMADNDPGNAFSGCGRSASVKAITDRLIANARPQDQINVGAINFSSSAATIAGLQPVAQFQANVSHGMLCAQNGGTNYDAALSQAASALANVQGTKVVYFITDGQPSMVGQGQDAQAEAAGLAAAQRLRSIQNLTLNAIYLGASNATAQNYLTQVTGAPDRVRLVGNASQLAEEILKFALPEIIVVENTARGSLRIESNNTNQPVGIKSFTKSRSGVWAYETDAFSMASGTTANNSVQHFTVTARDAGGKTQTSTVVIDFQFLD